MFNMSTEDKLKNVSPTFGNTVLYAAFSVIPLDIEGSNLQNTGWMLSKKDISYMGEESYKLAIEECNLKNAKVLFKNVSLQWDSCDCGDGYGCSHGSYVYEINIFSNGKNITIEYTDGDSLEFYNEGKYCKIPTAGSTIFDFIRMCEICEIELELSDYAVSLLK
jgi:hypothetical protein